MNNFLKDAIITLCGAVTSLLVAWILYLVESQGGFSFYSWMILFIIPVGAGLSGFVAASGYYLGARLLQYKPQKSILISMLAVSVATYLFIHYLGYGTLEVQGQAVANYLSFWEYLDFSMTNTSIQLGVGHKLHAIGDPIELHSLGYVYALFQVIGFVVGGFAVYAYLSMQSYCEECLRYFSKKGCVSRYLETKDSLVDFLTKFNQLLETFSLPEIISLHHKTGEKKFDKKRDYLRVDLTIKSCKQCEKHRLALNVFKLKGKEWDELEDLSVEAETEKELSFLA